MERLLRRGRVQMGWEGADLPAFVLRAEDAQRAAGNGQCSQPCRGELGDSSECTGWVSKWGSAGSALGESPMGTVTDRLD